MPAAGLTDEEIDSFVRDGFVRVEGAFPRVVAEEGRALLRDEMGLSPHEPAGWSEPVIRLPGSGAPPFDRAVNTERLHAVLRSAGGSRALGPAIRARNLSHPLSPPARAGRHRLAR